MKTCLANVYAAGPTNLDVSAAELCLLDCESTLQEAEGTGGVGGGRVRRGVNDGGSSGSSGTVKEGDGKRHEGTSEVKVSRAKMLLLEADTVLQCANLEVEVV
jgi:hypothetical protein